jgi:DNA-directed RNA polymerase subunit RPC12/RpoP
MENTNMDLKARIAEKIKVEAAQQVEARTSLYNPLLQKPVALEPVGPGSYPAGLGGYAYIGPPPDFGGSYGCYVDAVGRKQYGIKSSKHYSIYDGSPVALQSELSADEREALLTQMDDISESYKCESCRAELTVSAFIQAEKVHCPYCSSEMTGAVEKLKQCYSKLEEKNMSKEPVKAEMDIAKEAMKMDAPKEMNEQVPDAKKAVMEEPSAALKEATDLKETDCGLEAKPSTVKADATPVAPAAPVVDVAAEQAAAQEKEQIAAKLARKERIEAAKAKFAAKRKERAVASMKKRQEIKAKAERDEAQKLRRELRVMATLEPAKFAEMKKNEKLATVCAEVEAKLFSKEERAQVRKELAVLAQENPEQAEEARKELEFIAPEILMEQDEMAAPMEVPMEETAPKAESAKEENKDGEIEHAEAEMAESMKTEFLASLKDLQGVKVEMSLHGEDTANPFWNVTIDAEPVGRIFLNDQENAEQIRAGFLADSYAENFGTALSQVGVEKMLTLTKTRLFAHQIDEVASLERLRVKARAEVKAEFDAKLETIRQDFLKATQTAIMASDKNIYQDEAGHALKGSMFNSLVAGLAVDPTYAVQAIEAGFEASNDYFDFVTKKAVEIMDMPKEARDSFENVVNASGKVQIADENKAEEETLRHRLIKASTNAVAMGGVIGGEDKEMVRQSLGLKGSAR